MRVAHRVSHIDRKYPRKYERYWHRLSPSKTIKTVTIWILDTVENGSDRFSLRSFSRRLFAIFSNSMCTQDDKKSRYFIVILFFTAFLNLTSSQNSVIDKRSLVNSCIDSNNHKQEPGPEDSLHQQVWKLSHLNRKNLPNGALFYSLLLFISFFSVHHGRTIHAVQEQPLWMLMEEKCMALTTITARTTKCQTNALNISHKIYVFMNVHQMLDLGCSWYVL